MDMFIPLRKVDAAQRMVYGSIDETPDRAGEVFDYASCKPQFQRWSENQRKASGGKSLGNIRAMHGPSAAGRLDSIAYDDQRKSIQLAAKVVDEDAWRKIEEGVYTGFSPGGRYLDKWPDGDYTRYTAQPVEVSLVDLPCIPSATFTMVKTDGIVEQRGFKLNSVQAGATTGLKTEGLSKEGRRHSAVDLSRVQLMHDTAVDLGASCPGAGPFADLSAGDDAAAGSGSDKLMKMMGELRGLKDELARLGSERDALAKRVAALESLPRAGGARLRAVDKSADALGTGAETEEERIARIRALPNGLEKSLALIKLAHQNPTIVRW